MLDDKFKKNNKLTGNGVNYIKDLFIDLHILIWIHYG